MKPLARPKRASFKQLFEYYQFLQSRPDTLIYNFRKHEYLTKRQQGWLELRQQKKYPEKISHPQKRCLNTGRIRGYNQFFRNSRLVTHQNLILHHVPRVTPNTK